MHTPSRGSARVLRLAGVAIVLILIVAVALTIAGRSTFQPALTEDGIPLPFGGSTASIAGSITVVRQSPIQVREVSFDDGSVSEVLQATPHVDRMDFVVTPESDTIAAGAPLAQAITAGKRYFGYRYTSRDAAREREAAARLAGGEPVTFAELFGGTFFTSSEERASDPTIANFERQRGITFLDASLVTLDRNARYILVVNDDNTTMTARGLAWCGDGTVQENAGEECDDGNTTNGDGCSGTSHPNGACTIEMCGDGYLDTDGLTDANGDRWLVEQCDDGGICIGGPRNGQSCTTAGLSPELMLTQCGTRTDGTRAPCVSSDNDGCSVRCHTELCGDGIRQTSEACDPGGACIISGQASTVYSCQPGNNDTETRDRIDACVNHGGTCQAVASVTCTATCQINSLPPVSLCGNGTIDAGEQCDDGNTTNGDGCSASCQTEATLSWRNPIHPLDANDDGVVRPNDTNALIAYLNDPATPKTVTAGYTPSPRYPDVDGDRSITSLDALLISNWIEAQCGNGQHEPELGEECDDGNTIDDDACSNTCVLVANPF